MGRVNVRVEARDLHPNASFDEKMNSSKRLIHAFNMACTKAGIKKEIKKYEFYETKSQKRRKKLREKQANLFKTKMKESFPENPKFSKKKKVGDKVNNSGRTPFQERQ